MEASPLSLEEQAQIVEDGHGTLLIGVKLAWFVGLLAVAGVAANGFLYFAVEDLRQMVQSHVGDERGHRQEEGGRMLAKVEGNSEGVRDNRRAVAELAREVTKLARQQSAWADQLRAIDRHLLRHSLILQQAFPAASKNSFKLLPRSSEERRLWDLAEEEDE